MKANKVIFVFLILAKTEDSEQESVDCWVDPVRLLFVKSFTNPFLLFFLFTEELFLNNSLI